MSNELVETSPETPIGEEVTTPELVTPDATEGAEKPTEPAKTPEQIEVERLRRALTKRDRTQGKMHGELEQLRREREQWQTRQPVQEPTETQDKPDLRAVVEREAMTLAERIAERRDFDAKCNSVASAGKKDFPDFNDALNALIEEAGPIVADNGVPTALGEQILEADAPAKLIHYLGKHPEIAAELDGLSPGRMARKLALIEQQMDAKPKTSAAPKPLEPVSGKATASIGYSPTMTDAQYAKWRESGKK
jgi:hypothetical protein